MRRLRELIHSATAREFARRPPLVIRHGVLDAAVNMTSAFVYARRVIFTALSSRSTM